MVTSLNKYNLYWNAKTSYTTKVENLGHLGQVVSIGPSTSLIGVLVFSWAW